MTGDGNSVGLSLDSPSVWCDSESCFLCFSSPWAVKKTKPGPSYLSANLSQRGEKGKVHALVLDRMIVMMMVVLEMVVVVSNTVLPVAARSAEMPPPQL